ncbi:MAG: signal recognition particle-docking protein FtsY [Paracoccaceae bacterium]
MAFFKKLKERMFKSSSKIDEGLDAIVSDGGAEDAVTEDDAARIAAVEESAEDAEAGGIEGFADTVADTTGTGVDTGQAEPAMADRPRAKAEDIVPQTDSFDEVIGMPSAEGAARAVEALEHKDEPDTAKKDVPLKDAPEAVPNPDPVPEPPKVALAPEPVVTSEPRDLDAEADLPPLAPETPAPLEKARPQPSAEPENIFEEKTTGSEKKGLFGRFFSRDEKTVVRRTLDDDMLEQLEELLISADMGVDTALRVTANMADGNMGRRLSVDEIKALMATEITRIMDPVAKPMPLYAQKPQVVLVVGVNGSGKTTTIGKLASQFKAAGKSVVIAAGDTFRAAAVEQLQVWGDRAGVPVLTAPEGSDPASLAFDAMTKAQADGADLLMIDTAGRLQNRADLMEELSKIVRVIRKKDPNAPHNTLLVLDATTGQNALNQVKVFQELADVSGLVMTKLDGTAKGGVLVALADKFGLPIHAIGVGEQIDDLDAFDPEDFANALVGREG